MGGLDLNRVHLGWLVVGLVLTAAVLFVVQSFVGTFVFGLFFYYATRPIYDRLYRRIGNRMVAAASAMLLLALPLLALFAYVLAISLQELDAASRRVESSDLEGYRQVLSPYVNASQVAQRPEAVLSDPSTVDVELLGTVLDQGLRYVGFFLNAGLHTFVMVVLGYYLLKDGRRLSRWFQAKFADDRGVLDEFVREVDADLQKIFFGNILNAILTGTLGSICYTLVDFFFAPPALGIPYAPLVGLLAGAGSLIPLVGMKLVYVPVTLYLGVAAYRVDPSLLWFPALFALVSATVVDLVPEFVLRPYVSAGRLHIGAVVLAYTFGPLIWGWYGLFLGPVVLVLVVHFARIVLPELFARETFAPYAVDPTYLDFSEAGERQPPPTEREDSGVGAISPAAESRSVRDAGPPVDGEDD